MQRVASTIVAGLVAVIAACGTPPEARERRLTQVLFVCEHGNVKSLMAATYFNQLANERGLAFRGVSRGSAPDSTTVPEAIIAGLHAEGFDISDFRPAAVTAADVIASERVITISAALPTAADHAGARVEQWNDVPPASADYTAAGKSLRAHVGELIEQLSHSEPR
jgi:arsenate reductase